MTYYKLTDDGIFIGVGSTYELRKYQKKHNIILTSDEESAQFLQIRDTLFRDDWFAPVGEDKLEYTAVKITVIEEDEYDALLQAIETGEDIKGSEDSSLDNNPAEDNNDITDDGTIEYVRKMKLKALSAACNKIITDGFNTELSDGDVHHFSLTVQDQLNLITLSSMVASGKTVIPYHADGELCKGYSPEDIMTIITAATEFKTYHTTYYNSLKAYVMSLDNVADIGAVEYGCEIPEEYQSEILREITANS